MAGATSEQEGHEEIERRDEEEEDQETCLNTLHVVSLYMQNVTKRGDYYEGFIDGEEDFKRFMADFQLATHSFNIRRSATRRSTAGKETKSAGDGAEGGKKAKYQKFGEEGYILWESLRGHTPIHFDCVPFRVDQSFLYECCYGPQRSTESKGIEEEVPDTTKGGKKKRFRTNSTRKLGCPAKIYVRRVARFPEYRVPERKENETPNRYRNVKQTSLERLREALKKCPDVPVVTEERYYLSVPDKTAHKIHPSDETAGLGQPVNPMVINKIYDFVKAGITDVNVVKRLLRDSVENMLFKNLHFKPSQLNRAYYPFNKDIRNHIYRAKYLMRLGKIDEIGFKKKMERWQDDSEPSSFFLAVVDGNMKDEEVELDSGPNEEHVASVEELESSDYLPDQYRQSLMENALARGSIKAFNPIIPDFLKGKPQAIIKHCMARVSYAEEEWDDPKLFIRQDETESKQFEVTSPSGEECYKLDMNEPSCECADWWQFRLPCKHMFLLFRGVDSLSWDSLPLEYRQKSQFVVDSDVFVSDQKEQGHDERVENCEQEQLHMAADVATDDETVMTGLQEECMSYVESIKLKLVEPLKVSVLRDLCTALQTVESQLDISSSHGNETTPITMAEDESSRIDEETVPCKRPCKDSVSAFNSKLQRVRNIVQQDRHLDYKDRLLRNRPRRLKRTSRVTLVHPHVNLPSWGGKWIARNSLLPIVLNNTSSVDSWLAIFRVIVEEDSTFIDRARISYQDLSEELVQWLALVKEGKYLELKALIARRNDLKAKNLSVNFWGNEYDIFLHHVDFIMKHTVKSNCSSTFCPRGDLQEQSRAAPKISGVRNILNKADILEQLKDWIEGAEASRCFAKFSPELIPEGAPVHAEKVKNLESGREETHYYCNGIRYFQPKVFPCGIPLLLIANVDYVFRNRMMESLDAIPDKLEGQTYTFKLVAVTLWSKTHYTCKVNLDGVWYHYDSTHSKKLQKSEKKQKFGYIPSYCIYLNVS